MEQIFAGILMLFPALFVLFLIVGGLVMLSLMLYHYWHAFSVTQSPAVVRSPGTNRRTGRDRRRPIDSQSGRQAA
ncbi:MAG: hypothetical protein OI74_01175 [Gammaproteobacteria bacterium (ex Lamellibrachia satsuma)]|nr:MAG: hypothetical protein OI74_01175 [Gammaproteobacteria bacterium (ex Lamellibrachia satsuma)]RRS36584.1 MAG: hypothetical protein NV67_06845 [Gammaproteobacteria bacterium (ex Lamellibrachia satsuma)]